MNDIYGIQSQPGLQSQRKADILEQVHNECGLRQIISEQRKHTGKEVLDWGLRDRDSRIGSDTNSLCGFG